MQKFRSIMEAVSWVCDDALDDHVWCERWVSELTISCQEAKIWKLCSAILQTHAWSSGVCCGSQHQHISNGDFGTMDEAIDLASRSAFIRPFFESEYSKILLPEVNTRSSVQTTWDIF